MRPSRCTVCSRRALRKGDRAAFLGKAWAGKLRERAKEAPAACAWPKSLTLKSGLASACLTQAHHTSKVMIQLVLDKRGYTACQSCLYMPKTSRRRKCLVNVRMKRILAPK